MLASVGMNSSENAGTEAMGGREFATTHWSVVLLGADTSTEDGTQALAKLCATYWYPLYSFARRTGMGPQDAEDLTQGFFEHFLRNNLAASGSPERGRFRSFLLASFRNFMADQRDRTHCLKRGGGVPPLSLSAEEGEDRFRLEPADTSDPQRQYELSWAITVLDTVLRRLEQEVEAAGRGDLFQALKPHLVADPTEETYAGIGARLGMTESAVKGTVFRLRQRYRELFRDEIRSTVSSAEHFEEELRHLMSVLGR